MSTPEEQSGQAAKPEGRESFTVLVRHRDAHLLAGVPHFYAAVFSGRWEAVAGLCAHRLTDPDAAARELSAIAAKHLPEPPPAADRVAVETLQAAADEGSVRFTGDLHVLMAALDLSQRVEIGQWARVADTALGYIDTVAEAGEELLRARVRLQTPDGYPPDAHASWGVDRGSTATRLAYHVWKHLGGGTASKPAFNIGFLTVDVERA